MKVCSECGHKNHKVRTKKFRYCNGEVNPLIPICEKCKRKMETHHHHQPRDSYA